MNAESPDMRRRILSAAVEQLRRYGPAKTTVSDVARALNMSHANVYRHFASKQALFDAVTEEWLGEMTPELTRIAEMHLPAPEKLKLWLTALMTLKRDKVRKDPEVFANYYAVAETARDVVAAHVAHLREMVAAILREGMDKGTFATFDPAATAIAVLNATSRFHHPHFVREGDGPDPQDAARVFDLVIAGLSAKEVSP